MLVVYAHGVRVVVPREVESRGAQAVEAYAAREVEKAKKAKKAKKKAQASPGVNTDGGEE